MFAGSSIIVMLFWHFIAEKHRHFQEESLNVATFLEAYALGDEIVKDIRAARKPAGPPRLKVRTARIRLLYSTAVLWLLIVILAWQRLLP